MTGRRGLTVAAIACVVGATLVLTAIGLPWVSATSRAASPTADRPDAYLETRVSYSAADAAAAVAPLGLLALAGVAALVGSRGRGRQAVGVILVATGAGITAAAARVIDDPAAVLVAPAFEVRLRVAPGLALAGGLLVTAAGACAVRFGRRWASLGPTYDTPGRAERAAPDELGASWDEVEREG